MGFLEKIKGNRVYLDTNIIIYALEGFEEFAPNLSELFTAIDNGKLQGVTSELTLAEVLVKPYLDGSLQRQNAYNDFLQDSDSLIVVPVRREILIEAAKLRASQGIRLPDAIHLATSLLTGCKTFLSNDRRLMSLSLIEVVAPTG